MTQGLRDKALKKVASPLGGTQAGRPAAARSGGAADLTNDEFGFLIEGLAFAPRPLRAAAQQATRDLDLGPRGAFILRLVAGGVAFPNELAAVLKVGRSLITAELAKLTEAGLIVATPGARDRRRSQLSLTPAGAALARRVHGALRQAIARNLAAYSADDIRMFARMLHDARRLDGGEAG